jgi:hypothetical protein
MAFGRATLRSSSLSQEGFGLISRCLRLWRRVQGAGPTANLTTAQAQLAAEQIKFELLTPAASMQADSPYLHFDDED